MKKIHEMPMGDLSVCLCKMAAAADNLFADAAVCEAFDEVKRLIGDEAPANVAVSLFASIMMPVLMNEKHKRDTFAILGALGCGTSDEIEQRNGIEVLHDLFTVFVIDGDVQSLFRPCAEMRSA